MRARSGLVTVVAWALAGCATVPTPSARPTLAAAQPCASDSLDSPPGRTWWASQRWRYADDATARAAYLALVSGQSPWPDWFVPVESDLPVGTRLQMVLGGAQTPEQPGGFATFDNVTDPAEVRDGLAVIEAWKPAVDRVAIYETVQPMRVRIGPIGPQVDPTSCRLLIGRWSQVQMLVPKDQRMAYLRIIEVRPLP